MKRCLLPFMFALLICSCTKTHNATNNYTIKQPPTKPAFEVDGIKDIILTNWFSVSATLPLSVNYEDSAQENVKLSLSALPAGITMDIGLNNNSIPNYNTSLTLYDTTFQGAAPGTYPVTLTATTPSGKQKFYQFSIKVLPMSWDFLGKYNTCYTYCPVDTAYTDSVYMDPVIVDKIWFANYSNSGHAIYGIVTLPAAFTIPDQTYGGYTYHGSGSLYVHQIQADVSSDCIVTMK